MTNNNPTNLEIIKQKAIEGGYVTGFMYDRLAAIDPLGAVEILLLDPLFWQSLGKALGWKGYNFCEWNNCVLIQRIPQWQREWHRFIDHLAEGKDIESFFKQLLNE